MNRSRALVAGACAILTGVGIACSDDNGTGPGTRDGPGLAFIAGAGTTDTVQAKPVQAFVVEVRDAQGQPAVGAVVRFETLPINPADPWWSGWGMLVAPLQATQFGSLSLDTTDARGRAMALVQFGTKAGPHGIIVKVPELGFADTSTFTVTAGAAARLRSLPKDTVLFVGGSLAMRSAVTDRFDNPRSDPITISAVSGGVAVSGKTVTAQSIGVARVAATALGLSDTSTIGVVPHGVLAVSRAGSGVATVNLDGSGYRVLTSTPGQYVRWAPSGGSVTFDNGYSIPARTATMTGVIQPVRQSSAGSDAEMYPVYSPDGAWIYFSAHGSGGFRLWRARADGTEAAPLSISSPEDDFFPSPSPDGTRLAYVRRTGGGADYLRILDLGTGAVTKIDVPGHAPAWSPTGDLIAYVDLQQGAVLKVMRPDGTGRRQVSQSGGYEMGVHWSPDGSWLIAYNHPTNRVHLVDVATGTSIRLSFTEGMRFPAWKP